MDVLIPVMNKLHDIFNTITSECIQLPQIVVIGTQSSGKSSVLESLVGHDFLPRGPGVVTRCPLVLKLVHTAQAETPYFEEWAKFLHTGDKVYTDFNAIRKEIEDETVRKSGTNKGISQEAIHLNIYSPKVINLTLVDLPGITKIPVGDQPENIESQIKTLIMYYIKNPNAIILAVTPANTDFVTSESLKLAKECDPDGRRTLAVVTKLDLMDTGTDALEVLSGRIIPVKLGIIGVINRSQQDIINCKSIEETKEDEALFLQNKYPTLALKNGTPFLTKTLNRILIHHIRHCLPALKSRINRMMSQYQALSLSYGTTVTNHSQTLLQIITKFASVYCSTIEGTSKNIKTSELSGGARICYIFHETFAQALNEIDPLSELKEWDILTAIQNATGTKPAIFIPEVTFELLVKSQIKKLQDPSLRCVELVYEEMQRIVQHSCVDLQREVERFPKLHEKIADTVSQLLQSRLQPTNTMVTNLVEIQLAYINTKHPDFFITSPRKPFCSIRPESSTNNAYMNDKICDATLNFRKLCTEYRESCRKADPIPKQTDSGESLYVSHHNLQYFGEIEKIPEIDYLEMKKLNCDRLNKPRGSPSSKDIESMHTENSFTESTKMPPIPDSWLSTPSIGHTRKLTSLEMKNCEVIKGLIYSYFTIIKKIIQDAVPKAIMHFLVNFVQDNLQSELVSHLYNPEQFGTLLQESEQITNNRKNTKEMLHALQKAVQVIGEIKEKTL